MSISDYILMINEGKNVVVGKFIINIDLEGSRPVFMRISTT
ncbi:hypothetical protein MC28_G241 (plasmid) [Bacillus thuringiensis MC28]|nr:hypothetical protein MC28_G241 [Bacillus thuringiensis MC28]